MLKVKTIENPMYKNHCPISSACGNAYIVNHKFANDFSQNKMPKKENSNNRVRKTNLAKKNYDEIDEMFSALDF